MENTPHSARRGRPGAMPGSRDSAILLTDAVLTLLQLGRVEAMQALDTLPHLLGVNLYRLPLMLLTWISFGVLVACTVYALAGSLVLAAGSFFLLQLGLTLRLEQRARELRARMAFTETRAGLASLQAALKSRCGYETH